MTHGRCPSGLSSVVFTTHRLAHLTGVSLPSLWLILEEFPHYSMYFWVATAPTCFLTNEFWLVFPNHLIMTQFESNDAILKGIISSQLGGSAALQLQPMWLLIAVLFCAALCTPTRCLPALGFTFFLGIPHPIPSRLVPACPSES